MEDTNMSKATRELCYERNKICAKLVGKRLILG